MSDNGGKTQPEESLCPYWQRKCSEVNADGKIVCKKLTQIMGMLPGEIAPHPMMMCQDDFIAGRVEKISHMIGAKPPPAGGLSINDILRRR